MGSQVTGGDWRSQKPAKKHIQTQPQGPSPPYPPQAAEFSRWQASEPTPSETGAPTAEIPTVTETTNTQAEDGWFFFWRGGVVRRRSQPGIYEVLEPGKTSIFQMSNEKNFGCWSIFF